MSAGLSDKAEAAVSFPSRASSKTVMLLETCREQPKSAGWLEVTGGVPQIETVWQRVMLMETMRSVATLAKIGRDHTSYSVPPQGRLQPPAPMQGDL